MECECIACLRIKLHGNDALDIHDASTPDGGEQNGWKTLE